MDVNVDVGDQKEMIPGNVQLCKLLLSFVEGKQIYEHTLTAGALPVKSRKCKPSMQFYMKSGSVFVLSVGGVSFPGLFGGVVLTTALSSFFTSPAHWSMEH